MRWILYPERQGSILCSYTNEETLVLQNHSQMDSQMNYTKPTISYGTRHRENKVLHFTGSNFCDSKIIIIRCTNANVILPPGDRPEETPIYIGSFQLHTYIPSSYDEYESGATYFPPQESTIHLTRDDLMKLIDSLHDILNNADYAIKEKLSAITDTEEQ